MKNHLLRSLAFLGLVLAFSARPKVTLLALAQGGGQRATGNAAAQSASPAANPNSVDVNGKKFDPRDLSGIWIRRGGNRAFGPPNSWPPLTKAGEDAIKTRIPSPGYSRYPLVKQIDDPNTLTLQLTLTDPEMYTKPWVSDVKIWRKESRKNVTWYGWYGLFSGLGELICAPMNANPFVSAGRGGD